MVENENNIHVLLNEVNDLCENQQSSIDLLYNKVNWILVSDLVLFSGMLQLQQKNLVVFILLTLSVLIALIGFTPQAFNTSAKISEQLKIYKSEGYIVSLINKKKEALDSNIGKINKISFLIQLASVFLAGALLLQVVSFTKSVCQL